ncbi:MAG: hypothetical protein JWN38_672 [Candidatus Saccharibacteria bacterium]|nr:hypothetical protein [Candidatus Saccharibacteria bacterium]
MDNGALYTPRLAGLLFVACLLGFMSIALGIPRGSGASQATTDWVTPTATSVRRVGPYVTDGRGRLDRIDNLNCYDSTYLAKGVTGELEEQPTCLVPTALGNFDAMHDSIGFNGEEEKLIPLISHSSQLALTPWPGSDSVLATEASSLGGAYLSLYRDISSHVHDDYGLNLKLVSKTVVDPPDYAFRTPDGDLLRTDNIAFSDNGSWLVVRTENAGFVRINAASLHIMSFAKDFYSQRADKRTQLAISDDGRYAVVADTEAERLVVYDLSQCGSGSALQDCPNHNYWSDVKGTVAGLTLVTKVRFINDSLLSFVTHDSSGESVYNLAPTAKIGSLIDYLALGDSFAAGEGAYNYQPGTDSDINHCHLSLDSYPYLITRQLYTSAGGHSVACSGARINDIVPAQAAEYRGQTSNGVAVKLRSSEEQSSMLSSYTPGSLPQISFASTYQPGVITVSAGGNDIGFAKILTACVAPHISQHLNYVNNCYDTYEQRYELATLIDNQRPRIKTMLQQLHSKAPSAKMYLIGYPQIAVDNGSCALNVLLNTNELAFSIELITHLNAVMRQAAKEASVNYVDVSQALAGHRLCEGPSVAVNGVTAGRAGGPELTVGPIDFHADYLGSESFHPNRYGQELLAQAILSKTHNFNIDISDTSSFMPTTSDTAGFLNKPKSGAPIVRLLPADITSQRIITVGQTITIDVDGEAEGLKPNTVYTVSIGAVSSTATVSDGSGNIDVTISVPPATPGGPQPITVDGQNQAGEPTQIVDTIGVVTDPSDYDNDGAPNGSDSCPTIKNSGIDADHDGIDDACDGTVTPVNTGSATPGGPTAAEEPGPVPDQGAATSQELGVGTVLSVGAVTATLASEMAVQVTATSNRLQPVQLAKVSINPQSGAPVGHLTDKVAQSLTIPSWVNPRRLHGVRWVVSYVIWLLVLAVLALTTKGRVETVRPNK